jgi:hypothetical protein
MEESTADRETTRTGQFILDELSHFEENFHPRPYSGDGEFISKEHYESIVTSRAAEQALLTPIKALSGQASADLALTFTNFLNQRHASTMSATLEQYSEATGEALSILSREAEAIQAQALKDLKSISEDNLKENERERRENAAKAKRDDGLKLERLVKSARSFSSLQIGGRPTVSAMFQYREGLLRLTSELQGEVEKYQVLAKRYRSGITDITHNLRKTQETKKDAKLCADDEIKIHRLEELASKNLVIVKLLDALKTRHEEAAAAISPFRLFEDIAPAYEAFRKTSAFEKEVGVKVLENESTGRMLTEPELDILLFHTLRFLHSLPDMTPDQIKELPKGLRELKDKLRLIVMVDEATDFSPLELACMELFALPKYGGVTM